MELGKFKELVVAHVHDGISDEEFIKGLSELRGQELEDSAFAISEFCFTKEFDSFVEEQEQRALRVRK